jgi:hypothetical protein
MDNRFCCIIPFFNPAKFRAPVENYHRCTESLRRQGVNFITIECSFDGTYDIPLTENVFRLHSNSVLWQKERLINFGLSKLPKESYLFGWLDCDILFEKDNWVELAIEKIHQGNDVVQLFKRVYHLEKNIYKFGGKYSFRMDGICYQRACHKDWYKLRLNKRLPFSAPGFCWAARRRVFDKVGLYDRNVIGSSDTSLVDTYFDCVGLHALAYRATPRLDQSIKEWSVRLKPLVNRVSWIDCEIAHLYHGSLKNRGYLERHNILTNHHYDPYQDVRIINHVLEWTTPKYEMHEELRKYFINRREDL